MLKQFRISAPLLARMNYNNVGVEGNKKDDGKAPKSGHDPSSLIPKGVKSLVWQPPGSDAAVAWSQADPPADNTSQNADEAAPHEANTVIGEPLVAAEPGSEVNSNQARVESPADHAQAARALGTAPQKDSESTALSESGAENTQDNPKSSNVDELLQAYIDDDERDKKLAEHFSDGEPKGVLAALAAPDEAPSQGNTTDDGFFAETHHSSDGESPFIPAAVPDSQRAQLPADSVREYVELASQVREPYRDVKSDDPSVPNVFRSTMDIDLGDQHLQAALDEGPSIDFSDELKSASLDAPFPNDDVGAANAPGHKQSTQTVDDSHLQDEIPSVNQRSMEVLEITPDMIDGPISELAEVDESPAPASQHASAKPPALPGKQSTGPRLSSPFSIGSKQAEQDKPVETPAATVEASQLIGADAEFSSERYEVSEVLEVPDLDEPPGEQPGATAGATVTTPTSADAEYESAIGFDGPTQAPRFGAGPLELEASADAIRLDDRPEAPNLDLDSDPNAISIGNIDAPHELEPPANPYGQANGVHDVAREAPQELAPTGNPAQGSTAHANQAADVAPAAPRRAPFQRHPAAEPQLSAEEQGLTQEQILARRVADRAKAIMRKQAEQRRAQSGAKVSFKKSDD